MSQKKTGGVDAISAEEFRKYARDPRTWLTTARMLKRAADILWQTYWAEFRTSMDEYVRRVKAGWVPCHSESTWSEMARPYMLLAGFAIENLLKGLWLARDAAALKGDRLDFGSRGHDLKWLSVRASLQLNQDELLELELLTNSIVCSGRYSISKRSQELVKADWQLHTFDAHQIGVLYEKLRTALLKYSTGNRA